MRTRAKLLAVIIALSATATAQSLNITVSNPLNVDRTDVPVIYRLNGQVKSALITENGQEIACQLDDIDGDGRYDELCFLTNLTKKQKKTFAIELSNEGKPREYTPQVFAELMLRNSAVKIKNKHDIYLAELKVERDVNPFAIVHHHGVAFESKLTAYRIYFDHRQTVDLYGKFKQRLELKETQFYPDEQQKANAYGDDVLWVGETFGLGTMRGWDGSKPTMVSDVDYRSQKVISHGPLRTIVEMKAWGWTPQPGQEPIDMSILYTQYAGHRDCTVDVFFSRPAVGYQFSTGLINVKNSTEYSDHQGLRGCWGSDFTVSEKDSAGHKRETVGLGICLAKANIISEEPANKDNYGYVIQTPTNRLRYYITFGSDNEEFGFHSASDWYNYLKAWKRELANPAVISEN